jgi:hypothetical protein
MNTMVGGYFCADWLDAGVCAALAANTARTIREIIGVREVNFRCKRVMSFLEVNRPKVEPSPFLNL